MCVRPRCFGLDRGSMSDITQVRKVLVSRPAKRSWPEMLEDQPNARQITVTRILRGAWRGKTLVTGLLILLCLVGLGFIDSAVITQEVVRQHRWRMAMGATVLSIDQEKTMAAKPGFD